MLKRVLLSIVLVSSNSCLNPFTPDPSKSDNKLKAVTYFANSIQKSNPNVSHLSIDDYLQNKSVYQLVDVRTPEEKAISYIPDSIFYKQDINQLKKLSKKAVLVSTIGKRSSKIASRLAQNDLHIYQLHGGILLWAHRSLPLVDSNGRPTKKVHVYGQQWDLLPKGYTGVWND